MHITVFAYCLAGIVVLLGIYGQWAGDEVVNLWKIPAAALLMGLLIEGIQERHRKLLLHRVLPKQGYLGKEFHGQLVLRNDSSRALRLRAKQAIPENIYSKHTIFNWILQPGGKDAHDFSAVPEQLGASVWHTVYSRTLGLFGLAWWSRTLAVVDEIQILPDFIDYQHFQKGQRTEGKATACTIGQGVDLIHIRDYQQGDPLKLIDWKATARRRYPMVRVFSEDQHLEIMLVIDCGRMSGLSTDTLTRLNHSINCAARLAQKAIDNHDRVGMIGFAERPLVKLPPTGGSTGLFNIRKSLATLKTVPQESNPLAAITLIYNLVKHRCLVVVFTEVEGDYLQSSLIQAVRLITPKHLVLIAALEDEEIKLMVKHEARNWLDPYYSLAALEYEKQRRNAIIKLRHAGTIVVSHTPDKLDQAILDRYEILRARRRV